MRKIEAIIRPEKLTEVKNGLAKYGVRGMTVTEVHGCGHQHGQTGVYRGREFSMSFLPRVKIEVVVPADVAEEVAGVIIEHARTGEVGDGKVFVLPVEQVYRIRTGDRGKGAL